MDDHPAVILRLMLCHFLEIKTLLFLSHICYCSWQFLLLLPFPPSLDRSVRSRPSSRCRKLETMNNNHRFDHRRGAFRSKETPSQQQAIKSNGV
jgi:hypothetical protein